MGLLGSGEFLSIPEELEKKDFETNRSKRSLKNYTPGDKKTMMKDLVASLKGKASLKKPKPK